ncbi:MAG: hypothetical protein BGO98_28565 [Myxococcales bacterium 68-20]|nr:hypothetical protein [Myxococcales bacterium]OJY30659.1 MAG: hypothetical protein BGO98_28565 [Myxococcales bacterium 68-20]
MMRWFFGVASSMMALAIGAGCQGTSVDDVESSEAANTEGRPLTVIAAREWGRCWFDAVSTGAQLSCTSTPRGEDPLGAKLEVTSVGYGAPDPSQVVTFSKDLDIEAGGTVVLGTFPRTSFPVMVMMHVTFTREASEAIGNHRGVDLWLEPKVDRPEDLSSSRPAVIKQPFDLWPVAFIDGVSSGRGAFSVASEYTLPLGSLEGFLDEREMPIRQWFTGVQQKGKVRYFAAPTSGAIPLELNVHNIAKPASIERPGYYTVTADGLRVATSEESARDFPPSADGDDAEPTPNNPGSTPDASSPSPPAPPADTDPSCGGDGQVRCNNTRCDDGTRWDTTTQKCVACGANGQTYCFDSPNNSSGNWKCDDGTRWDATTQKCVTCGASGQTYCVDSPNNISGNWKCDGGTRWDATTQKCVTCGASGQTYCVDSPNNISGNRICNPGLRYDSSTGSCIQ